MHLLMGDVPWSFLLEASLRLVVGAQQAVAHWTARHAKAEQVIQGTTTTVVTDGVLNLDRMGEGVLSQERLFALLGKPLVLFG